MHLPLPSTLSHRRSCSSGILVLAFFLACGGGSGSSSAPPPTPTPGLVFTKLVGASLDLWFAPADGSPPVALADSPDTEIFSRASGDRVLYWRYTGSTYSLCSVKRDGTGRVVLFSGLSATWGFTGVLDGRAIFLVPEVPAQVRSVALDGSAPLTLAEGNQLRSTLLDGKLFIGIATDNTYATGSLITLKADGTGRTTLLDVPAYAAASASGKVFALGMNDQEHAYLANLDGTGRQDLGLSRLIRSGWYNWENSSQLIFLSGDKAYASISGAAGTFAVTSVSLATGTPETAIIGPLPYYLWTVEGGRPIVTTTTDAGMTGTLFTVDPASHQATPFPGQGISTRFATTFQGKVVYTDQTSGTWTDVTLKAANLDGTAASTVALAPLHTVSEVNDAPLQGRFLLKSGDRLVFRRSVTGQAEVCSALVDGTSPRTVSQGSGVKHLEAVAGTVLVYRAVNGAQGDLFAVNADGTGHVTITNAPEDEAFVAMMGHDVVFRRTGLDGMIRFFTVPLTGGTPRLLVDTGAASAWSAGVI